MSSLRMASNGVNRFSNSRNDMDDKVIDLTMSPRFRRQKVPEEHSFWCKIHSARQIIV